MDASVIVVGAGPVGLALAINLGRAGIKTILLERNPEPQFLPKMERCNARSMEMFRRIGLSKKIRDAGLRADCPMDVFIVEDLTKPALLEEKHPSIQTFQGKIKECKDLSMPLEPYQLISQYTLEPLLKAEAEALQSVEVLFGHEFMEFSQSDDGVSVRFKDSDGQSKTLTAAYLVGCDGGSSPIRKQLGIKLRGEGGILELQQALFYCEELFERLPHGSGPGQGRHYHRADAEHTFLIMQDSTKHWSLHATVPDAEAMKRKFEEIVGFPVNYELLSCAPWRQNLLLADRYREGRVFLAGDSVHLVIPTGGLGMNTGVGDAFDLAWKLIGTLKGWGGPELLDSYEIERRQVGDRNVGASRYANVGRQKWRSIATDEIFSGTEAGESLKRKLIQVADSEQRKGNRMIGAELGYRYVDSPCIDNVPGGPEHRVGEYNPNVWPGSRLPHCWLDDGSALQDQLSETYILLSLGKKPLDTSKLRQSYEKIGAPVAEVRIESNRLRDLYGFDLLVLRPDMHVAWRGNDAPPNPQEIASISTGHGRFD
ncbi:FAD-dependent monooxygenase [Litoricolaceae bacterium]|nr:FAD-dependent monooxygenase [Litorivicinaceae bacterium]MDA8704437.1 FAD-dependent monooxygenase [Litorivicinaceae bacterium]